MIGHTIRYSAKNRLLMVFFLRIAELMSDKMS
ncbi:hypothetical protein SAMN05880570_3016 [Paenibacillus sp. RU4T]|nr:hypothetical protein SAMN05880555_2984 [Paenibacillus sp. RU4X]SIR27601.1 hypothetical protein SAMN05880570_3016 [Paenibacillus sp. RU4T]